MDGWNALSSFVVVGGVIFIDHRLCQILKELRRFNWKG
jgi:hypothetical protein